MNQQPICTVCGTQYPPDRATNPCPLCADDRQYVPEAGQMWTNLDELSKNHGVAIKKLRDGLYELKMVPSFAIGQRALLVITPNGSVLWDCIALLNEPTIAFIKSKVRTIRLTANRTFLVAHLHPAKLKIVKFYNLYYVNQ